MSNIKINESISTLCFELETWAPEISDSDSNSLIVLTLAPASLSFDLSDFFRVATYRFSRDNNE